MYTVRGVDVNVKIIEKYYVGGIADWRTIVIQSMYIILLLLLNACNKI